MFDMKRQGKSQPPWVMLLIERLEAFMLRSGKNLHEVAQELGNGTTHATMWRLCKGITSKPNPATRKLITDYLDREEGTAPSKQLDPQQKPERELTRGEMNEILREMGKMEQRFMDRITKLEKEITELKEVSSPFQKGRGR